MLVISNANDVSSGPRNTSAEIEAYTVIETGLLFVINVCWRFRVVTFSRFCLYPVLVVSV